MNTFRKSSPTPTLTKGRHLTSTPNVAKMVAKGGSESMARPFTSTVHAHGKQATPPCSCILLCFISPPHSTERELSVANGVKLRKDRHVQRALPIKAFSISGQMFLPQSQAYLGLSLKASSQPTPMPSTPARLQASPPPLPCLVAMVGSTAFVQVGEE